MAPAHVSGCKAAGNTKSKLHPMLSERWRMIYGRVLPAKWSLNFWVCEAFRNLPSQTNLLGHVTCIRAQAA